jgi:hypothetical protein
MRKRNRNCDVFSRHVFSRSGKYHENAVTRRKKLALEVKKKLTPLSLKNTTVPGQRDKNMPHQKTYRTNKNLTTSTPRRPTPPQQPPPSTHLPKS